MANNKTTFSKTLENLQVKISEYALEEAKAKAEKAQVELETAKMQQEYMQKLYLTNVSNGGVFQ